jgi:hypothetical protein
MSIIHSEEEYEAWAIENPHLVNLSYFPSMQNLLDEGKTDNISDTDKIFLINLDKEMQKLNYEFIFSYSDDNVMGWGRFLFCNMRDDAYTIDYMKFFKEKKKNRNNPDGVRIYIDNNGANISLHFILEIEKIEIAKNKFYIENSPDYIKNIFMNTYGECGTMECEFISEGDRNSCKKKKKYVLCNKEFTKCGYAHFEVFNPSIVELPGYIDLIKYVFNKKESKVYKNKTNCA